jgi:hypothetical protein
MPEPTLYTWVLQGRLRSRMVQAGSGQIKLVHADPTTIADLKTIRTTPFPWAASASRPTLPWLIVPDSSLSTLLAIFLRGTVDHRSGFIPCVLSVC